MKVLLIRRQGRAVAARGGGIIRSNAMIQESLREMGCEVVTHRDLDPLVMIPAGVDLVWHYGETAHLDAAVRLATQKNIPILVNSTWDNTVDRREFLLAETRRLDSPCLYWAVFTVGAAQQFQNAVAIPKTIREDIPAGLGYPERHGVLVGDATKISSPKLTRGMDVQAALRGLHEAGLPLVAYGQYRGGSPPEYVEILPYDPASSFLGSVRVCVSLIAHETFSMTPVEALAAGTPVLYRPMPQSLTEYLGFAGIPYTSVADLIYWTGRIYREQDLWEKYSQVSRLRSESLKHSSTAAALYVALAGLVERHRRSTC